MSTIPMAHLHGGGKGCFIAVEANIGAGKTTLCEALHEHYNNKAVLFPEPVDKPMFRALLGKYYRDPARWGFAFQMYALKERLKQHTLASELCANGLIAVQDRSIYADGCFGLLVREDGNMTAEEWDIYADTFGEMKRHLRYPDVMVYLRTDPEVCLERMKARNRSEEAGVPLDYLKRLHDKHEEMIEAMARYTRVLALDWTEFADPVKVAAAIDEVAREPRLFLRDFGSLRASS